MMANGATSTTTDSSPSDDYRRLHITPLDSELLKVVIPSAVLPKARNISYHTIETFPEKRYGFVDLPKMEADKLKKKLNGATLRGAKVKIDEAKPEAIPQSTTADDDSGKAKKSKQSKEKGEKSKKRKRDSNVIEAVELKDRKIKRGWTVTETDMIKEKKKAKKEKERGSKDKKDKKEMKDKKKTKSKYTDEPECLFKQKLPAVPDATNTDDADGHKRKKRRKDREVVIHEFEKTVKHPSFLKSTVEPSKSSELVFEDGKGWVDGEGNVVEPVKSKRGRPPKSPAPPKEKSPEPTPIQEDDDTTSSDPSSSSSAEEDEESSDEEMEESEAATPKPSLKTGTNVTNTPISALKTELVRPRSSGSTTSLTIKIPPVTPGSSKIHPLEALYKRSKGDEAMPNGGASESKPFSFFDNDDIEEEEDLPTERRPGQVPMTPFTKQDFEFRNIRSAAPTPDTAHPSRTFNMWPVRGSSEPAVPEEDEEAEDDGGDGEEMQGDEGAANSTAVKHEADASGSKPQASEEQKWFWDNRGDLNRAWKKRRRTAGKEKRNRANRARSARSG